MSAIVVLVVLVLADSAIHVSTNPQLCSFGDIAHPLTIPRIAVPKNPIFNFIS